MKRLVKVMLCIGLCLLVIGGLLMGCGMLAGAHPAQIVNTGLWNVAISGDRGENGWQADNSYHIPANAIASLEINWVDGEITVEPWDGEEICLEETSKAPITERNHLVYRVDGDTLEIDFWAEKFGFSFGGPDLKPKDLKILVPRALAGALDEIDVDVVASDVFLKGLNARDISVDSVSGSLNGSELIAGQIEMDTMSGNLKCSFLNCPHALDMDSVSGSVEIFLPEDSRFQVSMDSLSGRYNSELPSQMGAGSQFEMNTASGDFLVKKHPGGSDSQPAEAAGETEQTVQPAQNAEAGDMI